MSRGKISAAALVIFCLAASLTSIQPSTTSTYYYKPGTANQRLQPGHNSGPPVEQSIDAPGTVFFHASSWQTSPVAVTITPEMTKYIAHITFPQEKTTDGTSDGEVTLEEALSIIANAYIANGRVMPVNIPVGTSCITVAVKAEPSF